MLNDLKRADQILVYAAMAILMYSIFSEIIRLGYVGVCWPGGIDTWAPNQPPAGNFFGTKYSSASHRSLWSGFVSIINRLVLVCVLIVSIIAIIRVAFFRRWGACLAICIAVLPILLLDKFNQLTGCLLRKQHEHVASVYERSLSGEIKDISLQYAETFDKHVILIHFRGQSGGGPDPTCEPYVILDPKRRITVPESLSYPHWFSANQFPDFPVFWDRDTYKKIEPLLSLGNKNVQVKTNNIMPFDGGYTLISCSPVPEY